MSERILVRCLNEEDPRYSIIQRQKPTGFETLWRYMSTEKFVHMMLSQSLFVPSLRLFDDRREGGYIESIFDRLYGKIEPGFAGSAFRRARERFFALCFHGMECENELMWRSYAPLGGVALVTSAARLMSAQFTVDVRENQQSEYYFLRVRYGEDFSGRIHPIAVKQSEYRDEAEYRMLFSAYSSNVRENLSVADGQALDPGLVLRFPEGGLSDFAWELRISPNNSRIVGDIVKGLVGGSVAVRSSAISR